MPDFLSRLFLVPATAFLVAACGGGSESTSSTNTSSTFAASLPETLVLAVNSPTYADGSQELVAFKRLNAERFQCGFGLLTQDVRLDAAAQAHRRYMALNGTWSHLEEPGTPGFTGRSSVDRADVAGYGLFFTGEGITSAVDGEHGIRGLLSAPYHAMSMLSGWRDLGISFDGGVLVNVYGHRGTSQDSAAIRTYPCEGTAGTYSSSTRETPSPFANPYEVWGQPILVLSGPFFEIRSATISGPQGGVPLKVIYGEGNTADPNLRCQGLWTCIIPEPLQPSTKYEVRLTWDENGKAGGRTFSFETGPS